MEKWWTNPIFWPHGLSAIQTICPRIKLWHSPTNKHRTRLTKPYSTIRNSPRFYSPSHTVIQHNCTKPFATFLYLSFYTFCIGKPTGKTNLVSFRPFYVAIVRGPVLRGVL